MATDQIDINQLKQTLREFCQKRDWMYAYTVKNLTMAASVEMGEIMEVIQWLTDEQMQHLSKEHKQQMADEIADTINNLVMLADVLDINIAHAIEQKIIKNAQKYPLDK